VKNQPTKNLLVLAAVVGVLAIVALISFAVRPSGPGDGFISGNGRIEATEINVSAKLGGRVDEILVREGEFVTAGKPLVRMQTNVLNAQRDEALAAKQQAITSVHTAKAQVAMRQSELAAARANIVQAETSLDAAMRRLARSEMLAAKGAKSLQELDDDRARVRTARAALDATKAQAVAAQSAIEAARAEVLKAESLVAASEATVARIEADIADSTLSSPRSGRVQYLIAQPGEVVAAGAPILNLVDVSDVYMTFFLPETVAGRVALGSEVRLILDAAPQFVFPARVSFVSDTAQFTPKTVETATERQKLMFRVRAHVDRELLERHVERVKTGLPGVAWLKLDPQAQWPENLALKVPE
jgi:HlyD family secretion protein